MNSYPGSNFKRIQDEEYRAALKEKLLEEINELFQAKERENIAEEAADVLEVLECLLNTQGINSSEVLQVKGAKQSERGSFKNGLVWIKNP